MRFAAGRSRSKAGNGEGILKRPMVVKPDVVNPADEVTTVGSVFGTPVVVKGKTWLPLAELIMWGFMARAAGKRRPERSWLERLGIGALTMPIVVGLEWCHNFAHAAAARLVGKPMDALRITWGMPLVVYYDINDKTVTPRQHIIRSLGGPVFNALALIAALFLRRRTHPDSMARDVTTAAVETNAFLCTVGLLPLPGIDGGPILKWSLVERGQTPEEADTTVRKVDGALSVVLAAAGAAAMKKRRWLLGAVLAQLAVFALGFALGMIREQ